MLPKSIPRSYWLRLSLPLLGASPILIAVAKLFGVTALVARSPENPILITITVCLTITGLYLYCFESICSKIQTCLSQNPLEPFKTSRSRALWIFSVILLYGIGIGALKQATTYVWTNETLNQSTLIGAEYLSISGPVEVLFVGYIPLLFLVGLWIVRLVTQLRMHLFVFRNGVQIPASELGFEPSVPIFAIDSQVPSAYQMRIFGIKPAIVVTTPVKDYPVKELHALYLHEYYHLKYRHSLAALLFSVPLFPVSPNVYLLWLDFPRIERNADQFAIKELDVQPLVRAIRRIAQTPTSQKSPSSRSSSQVLPYFGNSYDVLFGTAVLNASHQTVDNRVETVLEMGQ